MAFITGNPVLMSLVALKLISLLPWVSHIEPLSKDASRLHKDCGEKLGYKKQNYICLCFLVNEHSLHLAGATNRSHTLKNYDTFTPSNILELENYMIVLAAMGKMLLWFWPVVLLAAVLLFLDYKREVANDNK
tara:strand:- start:370 stop:768 length:399 start_codon:yes stop_codon:yes gene_type:complete